MILVSIYTDIGKNPNFTEFSSKYPSTRYVYRFKLKSMTLSSNITNVDIEIQITCTGLNDCEKSDTNGEQDSDRGIIHLESIENWERLSSTSSWVNIHCTEYLDVQRASNMSFSFTRESIHDLTKFDVELRNRNRELLEFGSEEKKFRKSMAA